MRLGKVLIHLFSIYENIEIKIKKIKNTWYRCVCTRKNFENLIRGFEADI